MRLTIYEHDAGGAGASDYSTLVDEVLERLKMTAASGKQNLHVVKNERQAG